MIKEIIRFWNMFNIINGSQNIYILDIFIY